jgi:pilus assembly protein FimV
MVAKCSSRAVALLLALPSAAFALGLGDVHLLSPLNAPLNAEIELIDVAPDEVNTVQAQLASRDTFAHYGLDWPAYLGGVQVRTESTADGRQIIRLKTTDPISEPFVTLLVEVNWSHGHLVREYTMLLDPPVYAPPQPAVASAPVAAPTTGATTREGAIERAPEAATPAPETQPAPAATPAPAPTPSEAPANANAAESAGSTHLVRRGETLSGIAAATAGASAASARARGWMVAIYQANPRAFDQNMNLLRAGSVLRIPDGATAAAIPGAEANAEIRRQYAAWRGSAGSAVPSGEQPGRLHLVTPSESPAAGATPGAQGGEAGAQGRVQELEGQVADQKRLLDLRNAEIARLQAQLAAKQGKPAPAEAPAPTPPVANAPVITPPAAVAEQKNPAETAPTPAEAPPPAVTPPAVTPPAVTPPAVTPPVAVKPLIAQRPVAAAQPQGGSIFDTLMGYWWVLVVVALALLAWFGLKFVRSRRTAEFDDSLGRLAVAGGAAAAAGVAVNRAFTPGDAPPRAGAPALTEDSFLVEDTGTRPRPRVVPDPVPAAPPARATTADDTISSETAINLDQGDPLAEADFHMAYGLYDQAADLIRIAISREPARRDLKLKLLEVFFVWGNKEQFLQTARELASTRSESAPGEWEKILIMGKQLAPEDPLFSGSGAVSGAAAGGVDLDLEGGQSRVDFDILGEPEGAPAQQGVDLDIGAAVGHSASESTTNVTDRNVALLDNTYLQGTTGTTRQMTTPVRQVAGGDAEGPTVEQPALSQPGSPTIRQKVETALKQTGVGTDQTAELAIDDLGLDLGHADTVDQPGPAAAAPPEGPTLVAGLDEHTRHLMEDAHAAHGKTATTGAWQFDPQELDSASTQAGAALPDPSQTSRLRALGAEDVDVDVGDATGTHTAPGALDLDVGATTGTHPANGHGLDLDVGTATVPDTAFAATQRLPSEDLALPDLEPVTMSEVGTKLDLARAYMDMGDPDGARNILEEVLTEGSAAQKQEAQRLMESLP